MITKLALKKKKDRDSYADQAGLELIETNLPLPPSAGIKGVCLCDFKNRWSLSELVFEP